MIGPGLKIDLQDPDPVLLLDPEATPDVHVLVLHGGRPIAWLPVPQAPPRVDRRFILRLLDAKELARMLPGPGESAALSGLRPGGVAPITVAPITVAVCTRDRADRLRGCLRSLGQLDPKPAEILVVDSASTDPEVERVVRAVPDCRYLRIDQPGLSIARNLALAEARTDWIAFTDDDAEPCPAWLAAIGSATARPDVVCVTGPVLPASIPGRSAELFESYGGLNRGFDPREWTASFLRGGITSPPTWMFGAGASMAVDRRSARAAGGFDPQLGAGKPAGCSEDTDLFYRLLRAGGRIRYEPGAWVLHHHRADLPELRRQLFAYGRGHAAAQWKAFVSYGDLRGLGRVLFGLPLLNTRRIVRTILGRSSYPLRLILAEGLGNLIGPFSWRRPSRGANS